MSKSSTRCNKSPVIISIEGNIGAGKSTLVSILERTYNTPKCFKSTDELDHYIKYDMNSAAKSNIETIPRTVHILPEPIEEWEAMKDSSGDSIFNKFYRDQDKYAFPFQMMVYLSRLSMLRGALKKANSNDIIIMERGLLTDVNVFVKMLHDEGKIEEINYMIFMKWYREFMEDIEFSGIIYLQTSPEVCYERTKIRNRDGETVDLEYLRKCHKYHEDWLNNSERSQMFSPAACGKLILNADEDIYNNDVCNNLLLKIKGYIGLLNNIESLTEDSM
jgi:deoxyguanosine kinase